ncbi:ribosome biogenesis factor YjgA [Polaromonas sp.]|jgi:ribosome-associated protein|uniref:ribosome biogenesis factor YjgA n=1 Tax=Polaromonas sp. TaxID=1869339 RepID=UPI002BCB3BCE|nr:ribosome biogenesis factor YjgA [Polaromonas sp.]HQS31380.1 ribosome biogenesis factor YjgA [Polaromonas sp.]HQS90719.1 ribosome biogenesis factor YjgA [Polaromonas sp.]
MNTKTIKAKNAKASPPKGYWSNGRFVKPEEIALEEVGPPSKTQLKAEADEKQALGEALITLRADLMARLDLPEKLLQAIADAKKITSFEGRRRQMQFIGKLMRPLDDEPIRDAINEQANGSAQLTLQLHLAEQWRDRLIEADDALGTWLTTYPATDAQQLRALIRQARKDAAPEKPGAAPRHGKSYREIFQLVRQAMAAAADGADGVDA